MGKPTLHRLREHLMDRIEQIAARLEDEGVIPLADARWVLARLAAAEERAAKAEGEARAGIIEWLRLEADRSATMMQGPGHVYASIADALEAGEDLAALRGSRP